MHHPLVKSFDVLHVKVAEGIMEENLQTDVMYVASDSKIRAEIYSKDLHKQIKVGKKDGGFSSYKCIGHDDQLLSLSDMGITVKDEYIRSFQKVTKRLSRLFRETKFGAFHDTMNITHIVDTGGWDGMSAFIDVRYLDSIGVPCKVGDRFSLTCLTDGGFYKGHAIVETGLINDIIMIGNPVKEIGWNLDLHYLQLDPVVSRKDPRMDLQSLLGILMNGQMTTRQFKQEIYTYFRNTMEDITTPLQTSRSLNVSSKLDVLRLVEAPMTNHVLGLKWNAEKLSMDSNFKDMRFKLQNTEAVYAAPLYVIEAGVPMLVDSEDIVVEGKHLMFGRKAFERYSDFFGGFDHDDRFLKKLMTDGKHLVWRSPNTFQEIMTMNILDEMPADFDTIKTEYWTGPASVKTEKSDNIYNIDNPVEMLMDGFEKPMQYNNPFVIKALNSFSAGSKMLGKAASNLMAIQAICTINNITISDYIPNHIDFEIIVDDSIQNGITEESQEVVEVLEAILIRLIEDGNEVPQFMKNRIGVRIGDLQLREVATYREDDVVSELKGYMNDLADAVNTKIYGIRDEGKLVKPGLIHDSSLVSDKVKSKLITAAGEHASDPVLIETAQRIKTVYIDSLIKMNDADDTIKKDIIKYAQKKVVAEFSMLSTEEQKLVVLYWASTIYGSQTDVTDSLLYIGDVRDGNFHGIFPVFISLLQDLGLAKRVDGFSLTFDKVEDVFTALISDVNKTTEERELPRGSSTIRIWRSMAEGRTGIEFCSEIESITVTGSDAVVVVKGDVVKVNIETRVTHVPDGEYAIQSIQGIPASKADTTVDEDGYYITGCDLIV